jgi:hypothetical protein
MLTRFFVAKVADSHSEEVVGVHANRPRAIDLNLSDSSCCFRCGCRVDGGIFALFDLAVRKEKPSKAAEIETCQEETESGQTRAVEVERRQTDA